MHAFLLVEIVDDGSVLAGQGFKALFTPRIGEAAAIEDEAAAVARIVRRQTLMKRKTENADDEVVGVVCETLEFFRGQHALERGHQSGKGDGHLGLVQEPAKILQGVRNALQKVGFAFVEAAETISAESLHDTHVNVGVVIVEESFAIDGDEAREGAKIIIKKLLAEFRREIGFGVV